MINPSLHGTASLLACVQAYGCGGLPAAQRRHQLPRAARGAVCDRLRRCIPSVRPELLTRCFCCSVQRPEHTGWGGMITLSASLLHAVASRCACWRGSPSLPAIPPSMHTQRVLGCRVWPLDFSSYLLEAEHEAPVTSVSLAPGGLAVAIGTEDGVAGVLDVASHRYSMLLRSHCGAVAAVAAHPSRCVARRFPHCTYDLPMRCRKPQESSSMGLLQASVHLHPLH